MFILKFSFIRKNKQFGHSILNAYISGMKCEHNIQQFTTYKYITKEQLTKNINETSERKIIEEKNSVYEVKKKQPHI